MVWIYIENKAFIFEDLNINIVLVLALSVAND
jgi:hypothetical protein